MNITGKNITSVIEYLYAKRLDQRPDADVLQSWSDLSDEEAQMHLHQLFRSWGYTEQQVADELAEFEALQNPAAPGPAPELPKPNGDHPSVQAPLQGPEAYNGPIAGSRESSRSRSWIWLLVLPLLALGGYTLFKFQAFKNMKYLYVTTDNVSIRDHKGKNIGRMDIFAGSNSVSFLRTTDGNSYPVTVGDNVYQCRRVVFDSTSFFDFLLNKADAFGYVNENYVIEDKENFIIYRNVFKAINNVKNENATLTAPFRKVIVGSLRQNPAMEQLFIQNTCGNKDKGLSALIKHKTPEGIYQVVALLSDGNYYIFAGDPASQRYDPPRPFEYQNTIDNSMRPFTNERILFKYADKTYFLYDCDGTARDHYTTFDAAGLIDYAKYSFVP